MDDTKGEAMRAAVLEAKRSGPYRHFKGNGHPIGNPPIHTSGMISPWQNLKAVALPLAVLMPPDDGTNPYMMALRFLHVCFNEDYTKGPIMASQSKFEGQKNFL